MFRFEGVACVVGRVARIRLGAHRYVFNNKNNQLALGGVRSLFLTCREGSPLLEVVGHDHDGRHVHHGQSESRHDAYRHAQHLDAVSERAGDEADTGDQAARSHRSLAPEAVGERARHRARDERHGDEQRSDQRRLALALAEEVEQLGVQHPERERAAVGDQVRDERAEHDDPAPASVGRLGQRRRAAAARAVAAAAAVAATRR